MPSRSKTPHFPNLGNYVKSSAYKRNLLANHKLYRKQNNSVLRTGARIGINLHFMFSSAFVKIKIRIGCERVH